MYQSLWNMDSNTLLLNSSVWEVRDLSRLCASAPHSTAVALPGLQKSDDPKLGFICCPVHPNLLPCHNHLSFPQISHIAIHPSNYNVGEYLCVQLTFKCVR